MAAGSVHISGLSHGSNRSDHADTSAAPAGSAEQRSARSAARGNGCAADVFEEPNEAAVFTHIRRCSAARRWSVRRKVTRARMRIRAESSLNCILPRAKPPAVCFANKAEAKKIAASHPCQRLACVSGGVWTFGHGCSQPSSPPASIIHAWV